MVFCPYRPYPFFRRLAPWPFLWLGCWSAKCTLSLDTHLSVPQLVKCAQKLLAVDRRESGEDKREFAELLKQEWLGLERRFGKKKQ